MKVRCRIVSGGGRMDDTDVGRHGGKKELKEDSETERGVRNLKRSNAVSIFSWASYNGKKNLRSIVWIKN